MNDQTSILNDIDRSAELTIDELDAVNGGSFFGDLVGTVKAVYHIVTGTCDIDHRGILL